MRAKRRDRTGFRWFRSGEMCVKNAYFFRDPFATLSTTPLGLGTQAEVASGQKEDTRGILAHTNVTKTYCQVTL